jgi:hypothetical protein
VCKPQPADWRDLLGYVFEVVTKVPIELVIFDTISPLWPVRDENNAAEVYEALMPLRQLAERAALLLTHHPRKGDGQEATAARGSGALTAFVDIILELRRYAPHDPRDRRRVLKGYGRWDETSPELVIALKEDGRGYTTCGDQQAIKSRERRDIISSLLPTEPPGKRFEAICESWPDHKPPAKQKLLNELRDGFGRGQWRREGTGKNKSPYTYWVQQRI